MELVKKVTGETLNPQYFINYVREKFSYVYGIKS
jgi:carboxypeptidase Taq